MSEKIPWYSSDYFLGYQQGFADGTKAERDRWINIIQERIDELTSCNKEDDCISLAAGAMLALNDGLFYLEKEEKMDDSVDDYFEQMFNNIKE